MFFISKGRFPRREARSCESRSSVLNKLIHHCFVFGATGGFSVEAEGASGPDWSEAVRTLSHWLDRVGNGERTCASRSVRAPGCGCRSSQSYRWAMARRPISQ